MNQMKTLEETRFFETNFNILYQNMQSVWNKIHILQAFTEDIPQVHAICVSESWLNKDKKDLLKITNYDIGSSFCRENHDGGGVFIMIRNGIEHYERPDITSLSLEMIFEVCAIELPKFNLLVVNLYWPNSKREIETFYSCLNKLLFIVSRKDINKRIVLGGDLNLDFLLNNNGKARLSNLMLSYNFHQRVREATRVTLSSFTCIDLLFTNFNVTDSKLSVQEFGFSDHKGVLFSIPTIPLKLKSLTIQKRIFNDKNLIQFKTELQNIKWDAIISINRSVNENYTSFDNTLGKLLNKCIPLKNIILKSEKSRLTPGLKVSCRHKRHLKLMVSQIKNKILRDHYKMYCKILKKAICTAKQIHNKCQFHKSHNKTKSMWQIINKETNKKPIKNKINLKIWTSELGIINDPKTIANTFNDYFSSIGNSNPATISELPLTGRINNSFFVCPAEPKEILRIIKNLKNKLSFGVDEIPPILIKYCADILCYPYSLLINQSFSEGIFPDALKISLIKPIHKKGDTSDINNYRPIALLPTSAKIFETAMVTRLYSFCEKYKIFHSNQNGFRKNHSTTLAIYKYVLEIVNIINTKKYAVGLLLDMSKAYDRVHHGILLDKLYNVGVRGTALDWFRSYLKNRWQYVEVEHTDFNMSMIQRFRSDGAPVQGSIPQGSVLGCILFLIYINDLPNVIDDQSMLFADDISVLFSCSGTEEIYNKLNSTLNTITTFLKSHNLMLNLDKTKIIQFKPYQKVPLSIDFSYRNSKIDDVTSATLLGIDLDSNMNWKCHVEKLSKRLSSFIYALRHLKRATDLKTALTAYYAYAYSRISYGLIIWGNTTDIDKIFILQKKCIRILVNIDQMESCRPHFTKLKILTVTSMYILESCKFVRAHPNLYSLVPTSEIKRNERNLYKLKMPFSKLKLIKNSPHYMTINIYNHLPNDIKKYDTPKLFIKKLKSFLIYNCFYSMNEYFNYYES